jgi:hypothetical protein
LRILNREVEKIVRVDAAFHGPVHRRSNDRCASSMRSITAKLESVR